MLRDEGVFLLTISGGDPFLHPEIDKMLVLAHETFEHISALTNGTTLNDTHFDTIRRIVNAKGAFPIQVSLDSIDPEINDDARGLTMDVLENIGKLSDICVTITTAILNADKVIALRILRGIGEKRVLMRCMIEYSR